MSLNTALGKRANRRTNCFLHIQDEWREFNLSQPSPLGKPMVRRTWGILNHFYCGTFPFYSESTIVHIEGMEVLISTPFFKVCFARSKMGLLIMN